MKKIILLLSGLSCSTLGVAQSDFRPGFVLPLNGDTLRGEVDYRGEQRNGRLCRFRPTSSAEVTEYTPEQLRAYGFGREKVYQTRLLPGNPPTPVFALNLVQGKVALFRFTNAEAKELYYAGTAPTAPLQVLVQRDTTITEYNSAQHRQTSMRTRVYPFRNVLRGLMLDCPAVLAPLSRTELVQSQLVKVFTQYNSCVGGAPQYVAPKRPTRIRFGLLAGVHQATLQSVAYTVQDLKSSPKPSFGASLSISPSGLSPKLTIHLQALYVKQQYAKQYQSRSEIYISDYNNYDQKVNIESVRIPAMLRYTFPKGIVRPYVQLGALFALNYKSEGTITVTPPRVGTPYVNELEMAGYNLGLLGGLGVAVPFGNAGSLELEVRADKLDNTTQTNNTLFGSRGLSFLAGYTFGR